MTLWHIGHFCKTGAHLEQHIRCPQGKNKTDICVSRQTLHNFSSLSSLFSSSSLLDSKDSAENKSTYVTVSCSNVTKEKWI